MKNARAGHPDVANFPPPITPVRLRELENAFERACLAASDTGAGTLYYVGRFDQLEFAIVLEPEEPLMSARRAFFAGMNAVAEVISVDSPPEKPITFRFPGSILFDGGLVGGGQLSWPDGAQEDKIPDWLVFGATLRVGGFQELGFRMSAESTSLEEEGFGEVDPASFAASFARHLMVEFDEWSEKGFKGIGARYLSRLSRKDSDGIRGIDGNCDLLIHPAPGGGAIRTAFLPLVSTPEWLDPLTGEPKA